MHLTGFCNKRRKGVKDNTLSLYSFPIHSQSRSVSKWPVEKKYPAKPKKNATMRAIRDGIREQIYGIGQGNVIVIAKFRVLWKF